MSSMNEYLREVFKWNQEMRDFLESENIDGNNELWQKLNSLTNVMDRMDQPLNTDELGSLSEKVEEIHEEMEAYFNERLQLGAIYANETSVPAGKHVLPPLPYGYNALEPYISEEIMRLHHDKHHKAYVDGLNKAEDALERARATGDFSLVKHWSRELAFHGSGHYLHTIFWNNMSPEGGGKPSGALLAQIKKYFGSYEQFKKHFTEAAKEVEGVGWAILVWSPRSRHLEILQSERHQLLTQWDTIPLLVLDVWEHAYYLQYQNKRADYIDNWWKIVNWKDVETRFQHAGELKWKPV
ncbi:superoxide dismutase [Cytobacillus purgationiresistens]|uniref:superoxide dismutase n=1 Tax=Cytobacillus purgationiresistens TaxID=863449 RepID=A0ABU0ADG8_9BACI|nr:superoxide dismutase [Cytobacillus purgationiresistens]MDQ0269294.1 Fe-Mn family superoxide dismutase [Cytobacillus purgationiresistens]